MRYYFRYIISNNRTTPHVIESPHLKAFEIKDFDMFEVIPACVYPFMIILVCLKIKPKNRDSLTGV